MTRRILYVTECKMNGNGIDLVVARQVDALIAAGHPVELVSRGRHPTPGTINRTWKLPPSKFLSWMPSKDYYAANSRCFSWLGSHYVDPARHAAVIAWTHTAHGIFRKAKGAGIPCILNAAGPHRLYNPAALASLRWPKLPLARTLEEYELADLILVASDFARDTFLDHGVPAAKVRTIYRGADLERFRPAPGKPARPFIVASCGLLGDRKGTYQLLRAWARLALADAELWLIGHIPENEEEALRTLATPSVRFLGFRKDMPELLRQAHLHVLLSRAEGFAKVLLEAAASGVPNLCTRESGMPADTPATFFVADRNDEQHIVASLRAAYDDPARLAAMALEARRFVEERYSWEAFSRRVAGAVEELL